MSPSIQTAKSFRTDINGLRAWAVAAVVLYHFQVPGFQGGFTGVDIFFVISGFLMAGIIVGGLEQQHGHFSILKFYLNRALRIVPALIFLCAILLFAGWFLLTAMDYQQLGKHTLASLLFFSNILFWQESGYFDTASHDKWLLHTWSLSVEWQFYLLLPPVLALLWKMKPCRSFLFKMMMIGFLCSFGLSIVQTGQNSSTAFYLLPFRAWQMLAGGMVFLLPSSRQLTRFHAKLLELCGFTLVIASVLTLDSESSWPGWPALLPVTGTALILVAAQSGSVLTANPLAQWFGNCSYSIYLWHWPVVVAISYLNRLHEPSMVALGVAITILLSETSYRLIERPTRKHSSKLSNMKIIAWLATVLLVTGISAILIYRADGFPQRINADITHAESEALNRNPRTKECMPISGVQFKGCIYGGSRIKAIVIGDSHANALATAIAAALPDKESGILVLSYSACPTLFAAIKVNMPENKCTLFNRWAEGIISKQPANIPLVIINRITATAIGRPEDGPSTQGKPRLYFTQKYPFATPEFIEEFQHHLVISACSFAEKRTVYMLRPLPEMTMNVPKYTARALMFGATPDIHITTGEYHQRHSFIWQAQDMAARDCGIKTLDPLPFLCPDGKCIGLRQNRPIYSDSNHLSEYGNRFLIPLFAPIFVNAHN